MKNTGESEKLFLLTLVNLSVHYLSDETFVIFNQLR